MTVMKNDLTVWTSYKILLRFPDFRVFPFYNQRRMDWQMGEKLSP